MNDDIKKLIENDTIKLLKRLKKTEIKAELKRLGVKGYSNLKVHELLNFLEKFLLDNKKEIINIYNTHKLELDMFQKEVLEVLNIKKNDLEQFDLKITGIQCVYIRTHHNYKKYDRESVYKVLLTMKKVIV